MLKLTGQCSDCNCSFDVNDLDTLDGCCPNCHDHHGNVDYFCDMSKDDFIIELSKMSDYAISKYAQVIQLCAEQLTDE